MADPFVAEIRIFPFNFAPRGWAWCDGQLMPLSQNTALFSLLGTTYGGDGRNNFALPNLQGRSPMHPGQGPGLSLRDLGESGGSATVTLLASQIPNHRHELRAAEAASTGAPTGGSLANVGTPPSPPPKAYRPPGAATALMAADALASAGASSPHNNLQPYLTLYFAIALQGVFPPRT